MPKRAAADDAPTTPSKRPRASKPADRAVADEPSRRSSSGAADLKKLSLHNPRRQSTSSQKVNYAESSDDDAPLDESGLAPLRSSKRRHSSTPDVSSDAETRRKLPAKKASPAKKRKGASVILPAKTARRPSALTSSSLPDIRLATASSSKLPSSQGNSLSLDALTPKKSKALLLCPEWSLEGIGQIVWTFVPVRPEAQPNATADQDQQRCGVWWPAQNLSYDEEIEMTVEPVRLKLLPDKMGEIWQHATESVNIEHASRDNLLPFRSDSEAGSIHTIDLNNFQVLPPALLASGSPRKPKPPPSDSPVSEEEEEEGFLPTKFEFGQARTKALITENEVSGMPDMEIAAWLAMQDAKTVVKARKMRTKFTNATEDDLEVLDQRLLYPERVIANWPRNGRPKYYPALILGHDLPSPVVQGEERTQNSLLVKYHVQWPRGFDPRNSKPFLYRKDFYISSEPGFFNNELEPWGTKYDYAPADIVEQVKDHLDTLQTMVKGEYGPGKERHEDFLAASEMRRNEVDKHGNMATGDYSDLHIAAVTVFLQSWCTKFPVEGCEQREAGSPAFEQLNATSKNLYATAVLLPVALELLTIVDSRLDPVSIPERVKQELGDADPEAHRMKQHELAMAELAKGHWIASVTTRREMNSARKR